MAEGGIAPEQQTTQVKPEAKPKASVKKPQAPVANTQKDRGAKERDRQNLAKVREELAQEISSNVETTNIRENLEHVLTKEQLALIETETKIKGLKIEDDCSITLQAEVPDSEEVALWRSKEGVLEAKKFNGTIIVVFNSNKLIPEGCGTIKQVDSVCPGGQYNPMLKIALVDIAAQWDFLEDKYQPTWAESALRHELRHAIVSSVDQQRHERNPNELRRVVDAIQLKEQNPELFREVAYLDELHSVFFDVTEGHYEDSQSLNSFDANFHTTEGWGKHSEISSLSKEGKEIAKKLFLHTQGLIILKRMNEQVLGNRPDIEELVIGVGTIFATERSLAEASKKIEHLWQGIMQDESLLAEFRKFITPYKPSGIEDLLEVSEESRDILLDIRSQVVSK